MSSFQTKNNYAIIEQNKLFSQERKWVYSMNHLPILITDLALLLVVAGITTLLCKKFNQPSVIGYILAGFLIGPVVDFIPTVGDEATIKIWAEIGVIFLMFTIGLEFSLHKLAELGFGCIVAAAVQISGMIVIGFGVGQFLGWSTMDSIFLGGMLSVSSTMIVIKAIDDLGLKQEKFTSGTIGILIVEDIVTVFMLVILSTISVSQGISGGELATTLGKLLFYLVVWLIIGIFVVPSFLKKTQQLMNDETLLVVSLGICFGMVWIANIIGFSSELGAFLAGSILASTLHAERIEHLVTPCKDLFGAVFFVSVGLMVVPSMLVQYAGPIIILTIVTIVGKIIFGALGRLLGGDDLKSTVYGSLCLTQIGEFSFIIATLGMSLKVTSDFLYPVIVAVSVATTLTTPYLVRSAGSIEQWFLNTLPQKWLKIVNRYNEETVKRTKGDEEWHRFLKGYGASLALYTVVVFGIIEIGINLLLPALGGLISNQTLAGVISCALIYLCIAPFLPPLMIFRKQYFTSLWLKSFANHLPLLALMVLRTAVAVFLVMLPLNHFFNLPLWLLIAVTIPVTVLFSRSDWLMGKYLQLEARFLSNFNERRLNEQQTEGHNWLDKQLWVAELACPEESEIIGQSLENLSWGKVMDVNVIKILRGRKHINIPEGTEILHEKDRIFIMGVQKAVENFIVITTRKNMLTVQEQPLLTLHQFIENQDQYEEEQQLLCYAVKVAKDSPLNGKNIKDSQIKSQWSCFVIGLERELLPIIDLHTNMKLSAGDLIWVLGSQKMGSALLREELL